MKKRILKSTSLLLALVLLLSLFAGCEQKTPDIVILYTNDVHCGIDENIGYAGLAAYRDAMLQKTPYVTLVDLGDAIQGALIGTVSEGEYLVDIMNEVGYDLAILGNHEFDYGMERLAYLLEKANATYLGCNLSYFGKKEDPLKKVEPYKILSYGKTKVGFIGISTPETITSSTPAYFMEDGEFVYGFEGGTNPDAFYEKVQSYIDICRSEGADHVILMAHLGDSEEASVYNSVELIRRTEGADAVLDGHAHSTISSEIVYNKKGDAVLLSSTGTKLQNIGQLVISSSGLVTTGLVSAYPEKDADVEAYIETIKASYESAMNEVVAKTELALSCYDANGIRLVRSRETAIGNFCADAYRSLSGADIALVNGGGIRADLPKGDVSYADLIAVHPFGNMLCMAELTGAEILDVLEIAVRLTKSETSENGNAIGEDGTFQQVSGLRFTVDTSIPSTVVMDDNGMFKEITGARRVSNVEVMNDAGEYVPLDPNATYTVASHNHLIKSAGGGITQFIDKPLLIDDGMADYQVLIAYIKSLAEGEFTARYAETEGRITVK